ncbi:hypothetical protein A2U01_0089098, partial [Trifolium medium]|nr:hypothetical protein [Trifolium medium]
MDVDLDDDDEFWEGVPLD